MVHRPIEVGFGIGTQPPYARVRGLTMLGRALRADSLWAVDHFVGLFPRSVWDRDFTWAAGDGDTPDAFFDWQVLLGHLARRVGETGEIYANDISRRALNSLERRKEREGITNIETIVGEVEDPLLPEGLDMVFIVNAFHDIARQVVLLDNLAPSLKPGAAVVILDRDPEKFRDSAGHFLTREEVLERIAESVFELDRIETFLPQHSIYIIRVPHQLPRLN